MVRIKRKNAVILISAIWLLTTMLNGCGFIILSKGAVIDEPFTEEKVQLIRRNETTKKDILEWFGPPAAVARPGSVIKVPGWNKSGSASMDMPGDAFFKHFRTIGVPLQRSLVYYYETAKMDWAELHAWFYTVEGPLHVPSVEDRTLTVIRLWILIDEASGKVEDLQMEKTVDEKPNALTAMGDKMQ